MPHGRAVVLQLAEAEPVPGLEHLVAGLLRCDGVTIVHVPEHRKLQDHQNPVARAPAAQRAGPTRDLRAAVADLGVRFSLITPAKVGCGGPAARPEIGADVGEG